MELNSFQGSYLDRPYHQHRFISTLKKNKLEVGVGTAQANHCRLSEVVRRSYLTALQPIVSCWFFELASSELLPCRRLAHWLLPLADIPYSCQYGPDSAGWHRETRCHCLAAPFMRLDRLPLDGPLRLRLHYLYNYYFASVALASSRPRA